MANELTVTKEQTARFVHDAVEMETAVFTIDRAIEECEREKDEFYIDQDTIDQLQDKISDLDKENKVTYQKLSDRIGEALGIALVCLVVGAVITFIALFVIEFVLELLFHVEMKMFDSWGAFWGGYLRIMFIEAVIIVVIALLAAVVFKSAKKQQRKIDAYQQEKQMKKDAILHEIAEIESENHANQNAIDYIDQQIADLRSKRSQIKFTLSRFYNLGVIPPDYRYMDCAIMLDQIFRNDLADTMREAIKIYEERVFRGEVIKGMDRICSMLGNLSAGMIAIEQRLSSIDSNVKMMSQDLYTFSERIAAGQAKQQKATEQLIRETEMSRYATEQVAESAKNLEWHERRRQGWV